MFYHYWHQFVVATIVILVKKSFLQNSQKPDITLTYHILEELILFSQFSAKID